MSFAARFLACVAWQSACFGHPANDYLQEIQQQALSRRLYEENAWLALGHYHRPNLGSGLISEADDDAFFFAKAGKRQPRAELLATLASFFSDEAGDQHPQCRFPARYHWLKQTLGFDGRRLKERSCPAFQAWQAELQAHAVSLIFPSAYLNSPSSMFGHTFLRLDRENQTEDNRLLAFTVNYAADARVRDNELFFAYKGLFGGYPGIISVQPYYEKVKEYSDWENRDIWEYQLNLSPDEVAQLVRHTYEIKPIRFDYFFIDENCSYRILDLLEVARPTLKLRQQFPLHTTPVDTVRAIEVAGIVNNVDYRPSAATILNRHIEQLTRHQQRLARALATQQIGFDDAAFSRLTPRQRADILEGAYEYIRYQSFDRKLPREQIAKRSYQLLRARSQIAEVSSFTPPRRPETPPQQGHAPNRITLGFGFREHGAFGALEFRPSYHDLTDPWPGYQPGAQIKLLDGTLRYYENDRLQLEQLQVLDVTSLTPRNDFLKPVSWSVSLGARRKLIETGRPLVGYLEGGAGLTYAIPGGLAFALLNATLEIGDGLENPADVGLGPRLGWLYRGLGGQGLLGFNTTCFVAGSDYCSGKVMLQHTLNLGKNYSLRFHLSRERSQGQYANEIILGLQRYF
jgi:hypothetical protein